MKAGTGFAGEDSFESGTLAEAHLSGVRATTCKFHRAGYADTLDYVSLRRPTFIQLGIGIQSATQETYLSLSNAGRGFFSGRHGWRPASHNKGGHRLRAIELINQAMAEVRTGMGS